MLHLLPTEAPALARALEAVRELYPARFAPTARWQIAFEQLPEGAPAGWRLEPGTPCRVFYTRPCDALRALGVLMGELEATGTLRPAYEETPFSALGVMLDLSRNGALRVETLRRLLTQFALMGVNRLFLYMEDVYEVPGEPLFGYFRGRYSEAELREVDAHADRLGVEVIPFIQTLGHLRQLLQWPPYQPLQDTQEVLLAHAPESLALLAKMLAAATAPFRSRRIHLGMDEAHGIGTGHYRLRHGVIPPFEILGRHLEATAALCEEMGLSPMIWSDMFFRLGSCTEDYYDRASTIPPEAARRIPANVSLVYWDYYHTDPAFYLEWIARHREALGREPMLAVGAWTWNRFWTALPRSFATLRAGMSAARQAGVREAFISLWGDDGAECPAFSALPAVQYFADTAYAPGGEPERSAIHFLGSCGARWEAWVAASDLDLHPGLDDPDTAILNTAKWLLWHDPLLGFLEAHIPPFFEAHYQQLARRLRADVEAGEEALRLPLHLAEAVATKTSLHLQLRPAYRAGDVATLRRIVEELLPDLHAKLRVLWHYHRLLWHRENKPFGWEVMERRYGGLFLRLETLETELRLYLEGGQPLIESLACEPHPVYAEADLPLLVINHRKAASPSMLQ